MSGKLADRNADDLRKKEFSLKSIGFGESPFSRGAVLSRQQFEKAANLNRSRNRRW